MSPRKSYRDLPDVQSWVDRQGYALERETAKALWTSGFRSSLGRHYQDPTTGKLREIDLLADAGLSSWTRFFAVIECKRSPNAAWIVRETDQLSRDYTKWSALMTRPLEKALDELVPAFLQDFRVERIVRNELPRYAFSVVEATEETNDAAHAAMAQAVSGALGWVGSMSVPAMAVPVVVVDAPLFALCHRDGDDEPLEPIPWRRVLWGETNKQTIVDVVTAGHVSAYGAELRQSLDTSARVAQIAGIGSSPGG